MMKTGELRRLIELAFDYVAAETEKQANQANNQAAAVATDAITLEVWGNLIDYIREWNSRSENKDPMSRAVALQYFLARLSQVQTAQN
jgi:hypothetical protein